MQDDADDDALDFESLPSDARRSILEQLDVISLALVREVNTRLAREVLDKALQECRLRVARRRTFLPRGTDPVSFVGLIGRRGLRLVGGMCCGGSSRRSLHGHTIEGAWSAASYCGRQGLLVRSDGVLVGEGPGIRGAEVTFACRCDLTRDCAANSEADGQGMEEDDEEMVEMDDAMREQEEEARSRGWGWRPSAASVSLGAGPPSSRLEAKRVELPESAASVAACPGRSHVLGVSGAVYSARWHGHLGSRGPSASPWSCWSPPSAAQRVVELSALSAHVLLRTATGGAMAFGDPQQGRLGFAAHSTAYVGTPRLVEALAGCAVVGVAAGGAHSLFLTDQGECHVAGSDLHGQCGSTAGTERSVQRMALADGCAPVVQLCAGRSHTLLLDRSGRAYACGLNDRGQCGIETLFGQDGRGEAGCVRRPTLIGGLMPHVVRAMEAAPSLSAFEVHERGGGAKTAAATAAAAAAATVATAEAEATTATAEAATDVDDGERCSVWLAGHVEAFNIPGTNTEVGGVRFLPSCYQWQLHSGKT